MDEGRGAVDHCGGDERPDRVEALARKRDAAHQLEQGSRAGDADRETDGHFDGDLLDDAPDRGALMRGELEGPDDERDGHRVVAAGLALEDRAGAARNLPVSE